MRLVPKQEGFFDLFDRQAQMVNQGAHALRDMLDNFTDVEEKAYKMKSLEHDADEVAHEILRMLNRTFVTPLDREDIHALVSSLDDILDFIEGAADRMVLYEVDQPTESAVKLSKVLAEATELVLKVVSMLRDKKQGPAIHEACVEINKLENQGDKINRAAMAKLFQMHDKPIEALKWREVYYNIETAIDKCEDVADAVGAIVLKNS